MTFDKTTTWQDWGEASVPFDEIKASIGAKDIVSANEAQTRFDVIDRIIREVLSWQHGQIDVEEPVSGSRQGFIDYSLKSGDNLVLVEAKRAGAAFPCPTRRRRLKLKGSVLRANGVRPRKEKSPEVGRLGVSP